MDQDADSLKLSRTKQWIDTVQAELPESVLSPVSDLTFQLSSHCLHETPRRRLSLDSNASGGTPVISFIEGETPGSTRVIAKKPSQFRCMVTSAGIEDNATNEFEPCEKFRRDSDISSPAEFTRLREKRGTQTNAASSLPTFFLGVSEMDVDAECDGAGSIMHSGDGMNKENVFPPERSTLLSLASLDRGAPLVSPAPSSVFFDEDSADSGYSDSQRPAPRIFPKLSAPAATFCIPENKESAEDDGFFDFSLESVTTVHQPPPSTLQIGSSGLVSAPLLFRQRGKHGLTRAKSDAGGTSDDTPKKSFQADQSVWRTAAMGSKRKLQELVLGDNRRKRALHSPDSPSAASSAACGLQKRVKSNINHTLVPNALCSTRLTRCYSETDATRATGRDQHLVGDQTRPHALPSVQEDKVCGMGKVTGETLLRLLRGDFSHTVGGYRIIDCRFPYEYEAGHIQGAINLYCPQHLLSEFLESAKLPYQLVNAPTDDKRHVLIFYCEYSSKRGPEMCRLLRNADRKLNRSDYPRLFYPEMYILEGGYREFYQHHRILCTPQGYMPMNDKSHTDELKHFKAKSKSWAGADCTVVPRTRVLPRIGTSAKRQL